MPPKGELQQANINRSIRTIKAELEYLCDASIIPPQTLADLLQRIPAQTALHAPLSVGAIPSAPENTGAFQPPTSPMNNLGLNNRAASHQPPQTHNPTPPPPAQAPTPHNEKSNPYTAPPPNNQPPPPAYAPPPQAQWSAPPLAQATALYPYTSTDAGDLALQPHDHITVTEYMNAEWWKGRCQRTGQEGIFPRSYVRVLDEKAGMHGPQQQQQPNPYGNNYGNQPLEVSQMGNGEGPTHAQGQEGESKFKEQGTKFGKKLGNATIFGAGATMGGNLVNSIF